jgi:hypothetical protein
MARASFFLFSLGFILPACGGKIIGDIEGLDAAHLDVSAPEAGDAGFVCGEGSVFVYCDPSSEYCQLVKTSTAHHYTCQQGTSCGSIPVASSQGDCGCYTASNGEIYVVECQ